MKSGRQSEQLEEGQEEEIQRIILIDQKSKLHFNHSLIRNFIKKNYQAEGAQ